MVLLVPALTTLALAGLRLTSQLDDVELFGKVQRELALSAQAASVSNAIQLERDSAVHFVAAGRSDNAISVDQAARSSKVDAEVGKYRDVAASTEGIDPAVAEAFQKSLQSLDNLSSLRNTMLTTKYPDASVLSGYSQILTSVNQVHRVAASSVSNPRLNPLSEANLALYSAQEQLTQQNAILVATARRGGFAPGQVGSLRSAQSRLDAAFTDFTASASQENRQLFQDVVSGGAVDGRNRLVQLALVQQEENDEGRVEIGDREVLQAGEETANLITTVSADIQKQIEAETNDLIDEGRANAWRDAALVLIALIIAFGLMAIVARSMIIPLRVLRRTALDVARNRLPEAIQRIRQHRDPERAAEEALFPVPINTTEEVGQVARAFDAVQREAVRLAVEQVALRANVNDMFINLSRRSQALVERQIGVIDRLEQDEQDPDQLASLFELDHLATQMRRNSENLLVLSGTTVNRRVTRPVPVSEVLGAAVSEVEKYARIQIAPGPEIKVQGRVVNDLAHLIAELLDNATAFSKPTTKVTVRATETRRGEIAIRIHDRGVGMQDNDIIEANHKLSEPPEVDVSVAREMGLYVVGQLAKRHEIRVTLTNNDDIEGGVTAQVVLPVSLLHKGASQLPPPPPARASNASSFEQHLSGQSETTGVGVIAGVPKWTPGQAEPGQYEPAPYEPAPYESGQFESGQFPSGQFPQVMRTPDEDPHAEHLVERTSTDGLFTSTFAGTPAAPEGVEQIDYSYPPVAERTALPRKPPAKPKVEPVTERLPIYEDVLSRWFQGGEAGEPPGKGTAVPAPVANGNGKPGGSEATELFAPVGVLEAPAQRSASPALPKREVQDTPPMPVRKKAPRLDQLPIPEAEPATPAPSSKGTADWGGADEGWQTANKVLKTAVDDKTTAGLPKRVPNARLIPGSPKQQATPAKSGAPSGQSGPSGQSASTATTAPPRRRSAERLRQQFATYQRGVQMGRESLDDAESWDSPLFSTTSGDMSAEKEQQ
ncbi:nitrate- and nitrite sensing domain-containing protein [Umezawaea sp. Da 62-37]|uniref:sensor histidine kinase n=1 Tax=Umezawaea sp. Da 62-37 TaxID=3075927 RepID=UPI0028F729F1|nr:nitrate- and nitrite sensing domain-containing protein [Umezawaea sp. Da 62-37]WNV91828.1 nitrate- and nitrite sensing domain-containing protein [Umezawaea sp. Da 62-37]